MQLGFLLVEIPTKLVTILNPVVSYWNWIKAIFEFSFQSTTCYLGKAEVKLALNPFLPYAFLQHNELKNM